MLLGIILSYLFTAACIELFLMKRREKAIEKIAQASFEAGVDYSKKMVKEVVNEVIERLEKKK